MRGIEQLERLSALVLMDVLCVPVLALDASSGDIIHTNRAFDEMLGQSEGDLAEWPFYALLIDVEPPDTLDVLRGHADKTLALRHRDGSIVRAVVARTGVLPGDDNIEIVAFHDVTDRFWTDGDVPAVPSTWRL